jgi:hypothetical protein
MNKIRKTLALLLVAALPVFASAQTLSIPQQYEIVTLSVEVAGSEEEFQIFNQPDAEGANHYYLCLGSLGIGDEIIQFNIDPLTHLFIPLGLNLDEAMETLGSLQDLYKTDPGTSQQIEGCLAIAFPDDKREPVTVTYRKILFSNRLEFNVQKNGYYRSTYISKSDFNSLVRGVKFYRKLHPNE